MRNAFARFVLFVLCPLITLSALSLVAGGPEVGSADKQSSADKSTVPTVEESFKKLKAGILKISEADVLDLLGPPDSVKHPGMSGFDLQMQWKYSTHLYGTFKDGKLDEITGAFAARLPVEHIHFANMKRLRVGMTEAEVVAIVGKSNGTTAVDGIVTHSWGHSAQLQVSLDKDGRLVDYGLKQNSAVFFPPGVVLPGLPKN